MPKQIQNVQNSKNALTTLSKEHKRPKRKHNQMCEANNYQIDSTKNAYAVNDMSNMYETTDNYCMDSLRMNEIPPINVGNCLQTEVSSFEVNYIDSAVQTHTSTQTTDIPGFKVVVDQVFRSFR